jgi:hypothetical protein
MTAICGVEKLEFQPRSQFRRPLAVSMEISLGVRRRDRSFCVQPSLRPCRGDYPCRRHYTRGSETFLAPQFPTFSSISAHSGRPESTSSGLADRGRVHSQLGGFQISPRTGWKRQYGADSCHPETWLCKRGVPAACTHVTSRWFEGVDHTVVETNKIAELSTDDRAPSQGFRCVSGTNDPLLSQEAAGLFLALSLLVRKNQNLPICRPLA